MCSDNLPLGLASREGPSGSAPASIQRRFASDRRGNVAIIFALCCFVVVSLIGGAVDFGRTIAFKGRLQNALDSASLAAGSTYALDANHSVEASLAQAQRYFDAMIGTENGAALTKTLDEATQTVTLTATATVPTPFLSIAGIQQIQLSAASTSTTTETLSGGGESEVELSLMLDVTGSMGDPVGTKDATIKIDALKTAAKSLVDIILPSGKSNPHARIALVPFSTYVNLGDYASGVTGEPLEKTTTSSYQCNKQESCQEVCTDWYTKGKKKGQCSNYDTQCTYTYDTCTSTTTSYLRRCLTERTGDHAVKDTAPSTGFAASWKSSLSSATNCGPGSNTSIVPLTTNGGTLKDMIDNFNPTGATAGQLGTAWAWYVLSPNFSSVFSGASAPAAYGKAKNKKIAVLMTDGLYNTYYNYVGGGSGTQATNLCTAMKAAGIEVYTVGFGFDAMDSDDRASATAILQACATSAEHFFDANTTQQLVDSFKQIAYRSVPLHLSK